MMVLYFTTPTLASRMSVIKTDKPLAVRSVKRKRIIQPVRPLRRYRNPSHNEPNPMAAFPIHDENLAVQIEKQIERRVARSRHFEELSH